jgi:7-keto-8-aminopelargonate synthetase-like enzyme
LAAELGLEGRIELQMGTLSKAVGLSGGYVAGRRALIEWLINRARSFIYSTAPPPFLAHAARVAVEWMMGAEGDLRRQQLQAHTALLRSRLGISEARFSSAIVPLVIGDERRAVAASEQLRREGFWVPAIRYPTVARGAARLRITLSASTQADQIETFAAKVARLVPAESRA